ncbi:MAG: BrnT family toxin [Candidatus Eremiobacteraeota bacterium]|nr:BrnT family toxin [Candidatus Eremiobacteraeota bacterium]
MNLRLTINSFEWDEGNTGKNLKHNVADEEAEQVFLDPYVRMKRSRSGRYALFGRTEEGRYLFVVFHYKGRLPDYDIVRVISARGMTAAEKKFYGEKGGHQLEKGIR